jgi:hypothetical protein
MKIVLTNFKFKLKYKNCKQGLKSSGALEIGNPISYIQYTVSSIGNIAAYSIQTFALSDTNMRDANGQQLYPDAKIYFDYYGQINYNDIFMISLFDRKPTNFSNGNLDFTNAQSDTIIGKYYFRMS